MNQRNEFFTISRVCRLTGLEPDTLERVEAALGSHLHVQRTPAGNRLFSAGDLDCLQEIRRLLDDEGLSLEQVRDTLFPPSRQPDPAATMPRLDRASAGVDGPDPAEARASRETTARASRETTARASRETTARDSAGTTARAAHETAADAEPRVPALPVAPTVDLLLEAAEGLVQENLKLQKAVDSLGERCLRLEQRLDRAGPGGFLQRLLGRG